MNNPTYMTRRQMLGTAMVGATGLMAGTVARADEPKPAAEAAMTPADPRVRGPFLILSTPFTESGAVDFEVLANQARFVDWCGCPGMIWPQAGDAVDLLTTEEKLEGMEVLAKTTRNLRSALCLGVQGKDTEEMLMYARHVEKLEPTAIISRMPDTGKTEDDMRQYWHALAAVTKRPVILQTTGGVAYKGPIPSVELLAELGREFPNFGYVKEEAGSVINRVIAEVAAKPAIRCVMGARGGYGWLHELRLGAEGLITERAVYADLLTRVWDLHCSGEDPAALHDAYGKFLLMANVHITIPGGDLRGPHLYVWKKRGVFKNMISRHYGPDRSVPASPIFSELQLSETDKGEIDLRLEALKPYLKPGSFA
ncbi:MAG: dihydrodipicolinate synthase family protein [Patescibacteria group bacterium]|nr:dihydrodipicolinate synthase family protein [Patescibacteria group bacterium]